MATSVSFNGATYSIPVVGERQWGTNVSNFLIAVAGNALSKAGGSFVLTTADVNFGTTYGLVTAYIKGAVGNISSTGIIRLANLDAISWRNAANAADLALRVNASDRLQFGGVDIPTISSTDTLTHKTLTSPVMTSPTLGNVTSGNLANCTGYAMASLTGLGTNVSSFLGTPSSANLAGALTDKTGTGVAVFGTAPTLDKPVINQADVTQAASATTPAAGKSALYVNSGDSKLHVVDSSGNDVAVGSGSSGRNYMGDWYDAAKDIGTVTNSLGDTLSSSDRTANKTTWGSSNTSLLTIARSTNSELRQTYNYLITEAGSSSGAFIEGPLFTLDQVDIGKPVSVSFDVKGNAADGDYQTYIVRYNASNILQSRVVIAGNASTTSPNSAKLPTGTTTFNGFFVPDSTNTADQYALRIVSNNSSAASLRIDTLFIGPQPIRVGSADTDWVTFTPESNLSTNVTLRGRYRKQGDSLDVQFMAEFSGTNTQNINPYFKLPTSIGTVDSSKLITADDGGSFSLPATGAYDDDNGASYPLTLLYAGSNLFYIYADNASATYATRTALNPNSNIPVTIQDNDTIITQVVGIPITGWSSNVTMADRAVESYAADDGSSDVFGPNGSLVPNVGTGTGSTTRDFTFQTPNISTDAVVLECNAAGSGWSSQNGLWNYIEGSSSYIFGVRGFWLNSTTYRVEFGNGGASPTNGIGAAGTLPWSGRFSAGDRFRVRKISGGAQVGYPISSANIIHQETLNVITGTATVSPTPTNVINLCNSGSPFTITIGAIASAPNGTVLRFKNIGAGNVTLDPNASETIDGQTTWSLSQYSAVDLIAYSGAWYVR